MKEESKPVPQQQKMYKKVYRNRFETMAGATEVTMTIELFEGKITSEVKMHPDPVISIAAPFQEWKRKVTEDFNREAGTKLNPELL